MRSLAVLLTLSLSLATSCGGASGHQAVMEDSLDLMSQTADILDGVTDVASAEAARPKLEKLTEKAEEIAEKTQALGDPTPEEEAWFEEKYEARMNEITQRMMATMMRLSEKPEVLAALGDSMDGMR